MTIIRPAASMACRPLPDISRATDTTSAALLALMHAYAARHLTDIKKCARDGTYVRLTHKSPYHALPASGTRSKGSYNQLPHLNTRQAYNCAITHTAAPSGVAASA